MISDKLNYGVHNIVSIKADHICDNFLINESFLWGFIKVFFNIELSLGEGCEEPDCVDPTCSEHGACVHGQCYCKAGWKGANCDQIDEQVHKCLPTCSDHGVYDLETAKCVCNRHWTGDDCSQGISTCLLLSLLTKFIISFQHFVVWIVDYTVNVIWGNVGVTPDGLVRDVNNFLVMFDVKSMGNVEMVHVCALKDGMDVTARYVSKTRI